MKGVDRFKGWWGELRDYWVYEGSDMLTDLLQPLGVVTEMTEEDQMMQAIAMSLGENVVMATEEVTYLL